MILTSSRGLQQLEQQVGHLTTQYAHITADYTALDRPEKRLAIYLRDDMACIYCGIGIEEAGTLTLDHVHTARAAVTPPRISSRPAVAAPRHAASRACEPSSAGPP